MIKSTNTDKYRKAIIIALEKHLPRLQALPKTSKKKEIIKNIIVETLKSFPEKVKLPPIRAMASTLGVTIVSVQKAVSDLAAEGLLITKDRSAVISGITSKENSDKQGNSSAFCPFATGFKFRTDSGYDYQRKMWFEIRDRFNSEHPTINAEIDFASYRKRACESDDIMECAGYGWQAQAGNIKPLPIRRFIAAKKTISQDRDMYGDMHIPLYYRTYYLFYNPALLNKYNIPRPEYSNFDEQLEYLINTGKKCKKVNLESKPFSITHPVTILGSLLPTFLDYVKNDNPAPEKEKSLIAGFEKILFYLNLCKFDYHEAHIGVEYEVNEFFAGRCPLFIGNSSSCWDFQNKVLEQEWAVYPLFAVDNKLVKWPVVGIVSANTKAPIESVNFISFLLRDDIQSKYISPTGMIPVNLNQEDTGLLFEKNIAEKFIEDFNASTPLFLQSENDYYLANSVLNSEFWSTHLNHSTSGKELLEQSTFLARAINENHRA
jgi:ABC-type glycerol-3-phosphate transport system substrate-binding protein